jgi:cytochrome P450
LGEKIKPIVNYLEYSLRTEDLSIAKEYVRSSLFSENNELFKELTAKDREDELSLFLVAGSETTVIAMKILICLWATQYQKLKENIQLHGLSEVIIAELIQDSPLGSITRYCTESKVFGEHKVNKGDIVNIDVFIANKQLYSNQQCPSDNLKLSSNLVFGAGKHVCPGKNLALSELEVFVETLMTFDPADYDITIVDDRSDRAITFRHPLAHKIKRRIRS